MGVAYTTRLSTNYLTNEYKVFECATKYMGVISQNTGVFCQTSAEKEDSDVDRQQSWQVLFSE